MSQVWAQTLLLRVPGAHPSVCAGLWYCGTDFAAPQVENGWSMLQSPRPSTDEFVDQELHFYDELLGGATHSGLLSSAIFKQWVWCAVDLNSGPLGVWWCAGSKYGEIERIWWDHYPYACGGLSACPAGSFPASYHKIVQHVRDTPASTIDRFYVQTARCYTLKRGY